MSDTMQAPPGGTTTETAANPTSGDGGSAGAGAGAAAAPPAWYEGLQDEKLRSSPSLQRFKSLDDFAKSYSSMEKRMGVPAERQLTMPSDPNDTEGMRALLGKIGLPEKPEGYGLKLADDAQDGDKARLGRFAERMHKAGALSPVVQEALDFWQEETQQSVEAATAAREEAKEKAVADLKKEMGASYDERMKSVGQLLGKFGSPELAQELADTNVGNNPQLVRALSKIAERLFEPGALSGDTRDAHGAQGLPTPAQAKAQLATLLGDPVKSVALRDNQHPMHVAVVKERARLQTIADGRTP